ncbi:Retrovirus-related Pol polyprotein from transposon TNT 1-94-like protein, partial [Drosera capensis]
MALSKSRGSGIRNLSQFIYGQGYRKTISDHCVFVNKFFDGNFIILLLYVDDMLIVGKDISRIDKLKKQLGEQFTMKDMGPAKQILGIRIIRGVMSWQSKLQKCVALSITEAEFIAIIEFFFSERLDQQDETWGGRYWLDSSLLLNQRGKGCIHRHNQANPGRYERAQLVYTIE